MSRNDEYWRRAKEAANYGRLATNGFARAAWLRIARGFFVLAGKRSEGHDESVETKDTRPKSGKSGSLH